MVININLAKAVEIKKNYLRQQREPHFQKLDRDFQIAGLAGDVDLQKQIEQKRSALRDVTDDPKLIALKTAEEIKDFSPDVFKQLESSSKKP